MGYPKYTPGSQMPVMKDLSEDTRKKLKNKRNKAIKLGLSRFLPQLKALGFILIIISLLYVAVTRLNYLFFKTSYFEIKDLEVVGNNYFSKEQIIKTAGLAPAMNIFGVNRESAVENLFKEPHIKNANIEFEGLYKIKIIVSERIPKYYVKAGLAFYEIAEDGIIISTEGMGEKDLPIITGIDTAGLAAGNSLLTNDNYFVAQKWLTQLGEKILKNISEINFSSVQNPYLILFNGEKVYPKSADDFKKRYDFLNALLDNLRKNNVEPFYLDMRGDHIVVRPKKF